MAPSMAANINPQGMAGAVGRAVPLTFALATVGVLLVAYTFVRLTSASTTPGSVYGFVGATLGPRAGVVAGGRLIGTYTFYAVVTAMAAGTSIRRSSTTSASGTNPPDWPGSPVPRDRCSACFWLASAPVRHGTRLLLSSRASPWP